MIHALVFDFDGLLIDTESAEFGAWQGLFADHGCELRFEIWAECIGRPEGFFDPCRHLSDLLGRPVDRDAVKARFREHHAALSADLAPLPGVERVIREAKGAGLGLAVASSSSHRWVDTHLARVGLLPLFDAIVCAEDTTRHKPDPEPYLRACERIGAAPAQSIAFEDSPNGIAAAKAAGMICVAIPNAITRNLPIDGAHIRFESMAELNLTELLARF